MLASTIQVGQASARHPDVDCLQAGVGDWVCCSDISAVRESLSLPSLFCSSGSLFSARPGVSFLLVWESFSLPSLFF